MGKCLWQRLVCSAGTCSVTESIRSLDDNGWMFRQSRCGGCQRGRCDVHVYRQPSCMCFMIMCLFCNVSPPRISYHSNSTAGAPTLPPLCHRPAWPPSTTRTEEGRMRRSGPQRQQRDSTPSCTGLKGSGASTTGTPALLSPPPQPLVSRTPPWTPRRGRQQPAVLAQAARLQRRRDAGPQPMPTPEAPPCSCASKPWPIGLRVWRPIPSDAATQLAGLRLGTTRPQSFAPWRHAVMVCGRPVVVLI